MTLTSAIPTAVTAIPCSSVHAGVFSDWFLPVSEAPSLDGLRVIPVRRGGYGSMTPSRHLTIADHAHYVAALADYLGLERIHWVGTLVELSDRPATRPRSSELITSLILLEPAAVGGFLVPASEELARRFVGPAMAEAAAGDVAAAFDTFMRGVCGESYRDVLVKQLGSVGLIGLCVSLRSSFAMKSLLC